jgi:hypothetical protein
VCRRLAELISDFYKFTVEIGVQELPVRAPSSHHDAEFPSQ